MADLAAVDEKLSPGHDDLQQPGNGADARGTKRGRISAEDDDDDDDKPGRERRKIEIKFIQDKSRRHITFSKRKAGIMKKVRSRFPSRVHPLSLSIYKSTLYFCIYTPSSPNVLPATTNFSFLSWFGISSLSNKLANSSTSRHTNCPSSPAPRSFFWSSPRPVWSIPSPPPSCSHSSPRLRVRT